MFWESLIRTAEVEPSLYAANFARLGEEVTALADAGVRVFHYDTGDGHFVAPITIGPIVLESISPLVADRGVAFDVHLMVANPEHHLEQMRAAGAASVTFHLEAVDDPQAVAARARELGLAVGLAFNPETPVDDALAAAAGFDLVLCMCIHPGFSGQSFLAESLDRICALRAGLPGDVLVQVDGGITAENVCRVHEAGADLIVAGSSIFFQPDVGAAYRRLTRSVRRRPCLRGQAAA